LPLGIFGNPDEQHEQQEQQLLQQSVGAQQQEPQGAQPHKLLIQHVVEPMQDGKQVDGVHPEGIQSAGKPQTGLQVGAHPEGIQSDGKPQIGLQEGSDGIHNSKQPQVVG
jgi:hypothetical protein